MAAVPVYAVPAQPFYRYDGTNADDLMALIASSIGNNPRLSAVLVSADAESMSWELYSHGYLAQTAIVSTGDYITPGGILLPAATFAESYIVKTA